MALSKDIELPSGVTVAYHRIVSVNIVTNHANLVEIASYTSRAKREEDRVPVEGAEQVGVFCHTEVYEAPYDQAMTVDGAYAWVKKNIEAFADAEDVLEETESGISVASE